MKFQLRAWRFVAAFTLVIAAGCGSQAEVDTANLGSQEAAEDASQDKGLEEPDDGIPANDPEEIETGSDDENGNSNEPDEQIDVDDPGDDAVEAGELPTIDSIDDLADVLTGYEMVTSARGSMEVIVEGSVPDHLADDFAEIKMDFVASGDNMELHMESPSLGEAIGSDEMPFAFASDHISMIAIDDSMYMSGLLAEMFGVTDGWLKLEGEVADGLDMSSDLSSEIDTDVADEVADMLSTARDFENLGVEDVDGDPTVHVRFVVRSADLQSDGSEMWSETDPLGALEDVPFDLWVDASNVRKIEIVADLTGTEAGVVTTTSIIMSDLNDPELVVEAPPADEVTVLSEEELMIALFGAMGGDFEDAFEELDDESALSDANAYGDDPELDALYDNCKDGDGQACDALYFDSPFGSEYEDFGSTCGGRGTELVCADVYKT